MTDTRKPDEQPSQEPYFDDWEHREAARDLTATYASQVYVQPLADGMIRINFGEAQLEDLAPKYHTAVVLSARNGLEFAQLVHRISMAVLGPTAPPPIIAPTVAAVSPEEPGDR